MASKNAFFASGETAAFSNKPVISLSKILYSFVKDAMFLVLVVLADLPNCNNFCLYWFIKEKSAL